MIVTQPWQNNYVYVRGFGALEPVRNLVLGKACNVLVTPRPPTRPTTTPSTTPMTSTVTPAFIPSVNGKKPHRLCECDSRKCVLR